MSIDNDTEARLRTIVREMQKSVSIVRDRTPHLPQQIEAAAAVERWANGILEALHHAEHVPNELQTYASAAENALNLIAKACGFAREWDYPLQIVRDVEDRMRELEALKAAAAEHPAREWDHALQIVRDVLVSLANALQSKAHDAERSEGESLDISMTNFYRSRARAFRDAEKMARLAAAEPSYRRAYILDQNSPRPEPAAGGVNSSNTDIEQVAAALADASNALARIAAEHDSMVCELTAYQVGDTNAEIAGELAAAGDDGDDEARGGRR
jgi:hypothetical protein